jgi:hypothetical protein
MWTRKAVLSQPGLCTTDTLKNQPLDRHDDGCLLWVGSSPSQKGNTDVRRGGSVKVRLPQISCRSPGKGITANLAEEYLITLLREQSLQRKSCRSELPLALYTPKVRGGWT